MTWSDGLFHLTRAVPSCMGQVVWVKCRLRWEVFAGKVDSSVCALDEMKFFTGNGMCHSRCLAEIGLARWTKMEVGAFHVKNLHR